MSLFFNKKAVQTFKKKINLLISASGFYGYDHCILIILLFLSNLITMLRSHCKGLKCCFLCVLYSLLLMNSQRLCVIEHHIMPSLTSVLCARQVNFDLFVWATEHRDRCITSDDETIRVSAKLSIISHPKMNKRIKLISDILCTCISIADIQIKVGFFYFRMNSSECTDSEKH